MAISDHATSTNARQRSNCASREQLGFSKDTNVILLHVMRLDLSVFNKARLLCFTAPALRLLSGIATKISFCTKNKKKFTASAKKLQCRYAHSFAPVESVLLIAENKNKTKLEHFRRGFALSMAKSQCGEA